VQVGKTIMFARGALTASILTLLSTGLFAASRPIVPDLPSATVMCYHIVEHPAAPRMHIDRETFRQHLRYLEMTGYNVIPLSELYEYIAGTRETLPKNAVVITIDDGWRSTYTEVFPELQRRKFPFTVFIYPNIIGKTANALTWKQIREMAEAGVDIQSHSLTHPYLTKRHHASLSADEYAKWLARELTESKRILEKQTGKKVEFLAYPYGDYDKTVAKAATDAGYIAALTCNYGSVRRGTDPMHMRRFVIDDKMDFADFRGYLGAKPMRLAEMTPKPGSAVDPGVTLISAKIPGFESLDPQSVGMALLSLGSMVPYSYDARNGEVTLALQDAISTLKSKYHRALVWGTDRKSGKRVEATWVFHLPEPPKPPVEPPQALPAVTPARVVTASTMAPTGGAPKK
jgi:peptidoglycan/xylan/chitin deacetylase (PgdA/CDA1 family)